MSATDRPFFRTDLVSRPIESSGHRFIEVTDPDSGHSFRFYEIEYAIACAMDGERDVDELADWAKYELGVDPSRDEIQTVIGTLGDLGYLDTGESTGDGHAVGHEVDYGQERSAAPTQPPPLGSPPPAGRLYDGEGPTEVSPPRSSELSTDLSEHIPVRAADVKEAVRQSRAIQAQKPPIEVVDEDEGFDDEKTPAPAARQPVRAPAAAAASAPDKGRPDAARNEAAMSPALGKTLLGTMAPAQPQPKGARSPTPAPMVLPETPAEISSPLGAAPSAAAAATTGRPGTNPSVAPPARSTATARDSAVRPMLPSRRPGALLPYLVVLLLLSGAGALAYWWFFVRQEDTAQGSTGESGAPPTAPSAIEGGAGAAVPTPEPPPPAEITATLEAGPTEEQEVKSDRAGLVAWLAASGAEVAEGAPVAKFDGYQKWDYAVKEAQDSQKRYQEKLDQATAKGDNDAMKEAEGNVKRKQGDIDRNVAELDKFLLKAPIGGVVEPSIKQRSQAKKDQPVAKILATSAPRATFALPAGTASPEGDVRVVSKADPGLAATCKVVSAEGGQLAVTCPTDSGLASGSEVVLKLP